jgi:hypothetical protein
MANNSEHLERITTTKHGLESIFAERDDVLVAANLLWYPLQGKPRTAMAPDVMVAFGRPKGKRKSYKQWEEGGTAPHFRQIHIKCFPASVGFDCYRSVSAARLKAKNTSFNGCETELVGSCKTSS